jgi:hypothetical protein
VASNELLIIGQFWFANNPDLVVPGRLDLTGERPRVELHGALSSSVREVPSGVPGISQFVNAPPPKPQTLYGEVLGIARRVTVIDAYQVHKTGDVLSMWSDGSSGGLQQQILEGEYAILGVHAQDADVPFSALRFRLCFQDAWAQLSGLSMSINPDPNNRSVAMNYGIPEPIVVPLPGGDGHLTLEAASTISPLRVAGAYILTRTYLKVELDEGVTVRAAWARFVLSASALLTLLHDKACKPTEFEVQDVASGKWYRVHMPGLVSDPSDVRSPKIDEPALLTRSELGMERLAAWFDLAHRLAPLPYVVADAVQATGRAVESLLLELAAAAEGIHRRLYPGSRRLTEQETSEALEALKELDLNPAAKEVLRSAMGTYLWDVSFPQRLRQLSEDVSSAMPGVTGKPGKWKSAVCDARNGFAHFLVGKEGDEVKILGYAALHKSLRWLLTGRILLELGVPAELLSQRLAEFRRYNHFLMNAKESLPNIYG